MKHLGTSVEDIKIAYVGGGSKLWAWGLMSDLAVAEDISGDVALYDIDMEAARANEIIGNKANDVEGCKSKWNYKAYDTLEGALKGADFVIISILPGTFDQMESDVHEPEKYGIYQSVGDTYGPGGTLRALRTIPMYEEIAYAIRDNCPNAWVISYTNPMTLCTRALYRAFPEIKAFGCCHEVFSTQGLLINALEDKLGIKDVKREDMKVNVIGVNHFTWLTEAKYKNIDMMPIYKEFVEEHYEKGYSRNTNEDYWKSSPFANRMKVKFDLFKRFGYIAAAGDRHLAEFCPPKWYLADNECVKEDFLFRLTPVSWRKNEFSEKLAKRARIVSGEEQFEFKETGEDGVNQIRALLGLHTFVTNVNLPNRGQIPNLPLGAVVETNAVFSSDSVRPVFAGEIPAEIYPLISRICGVQELVSEAAAERNLDKAFRAFMMQVDLPIADAKKLFDTMIENTKKYLEEYGV